jgi:hypothetical protein
MPRQRQLWRFGLTLYAISFFLISAADAVADAYPTRGVLCAWAAFVLPLDFRLWPEDSPVFLLPSVLLSGWINPLFLVATVLYLWDHRKRLFGVIRVIITLCFPACLVALNLQGMVPREGFFLWAVGILLCLYADLLVRAFQPPQRVNRAI